MGNVLIQIFVRGFYKKYAKLFFIVFCLIASYFLFIQIAGVFLEHNRDFWTLFLALQFATEPLFILIFWIISFLFITLVFRFISSEIQTQKLEFLKYTFFVLDRKERIKSWLRIFSLINLPILIYGLFSLLVGYVLLGKLTGFWSILYILLLNFIMIYWIDFNRFNIKNHNRIAAFYSSINPKEYYWIFNLINQLKTNLTLFVGTKVVCIISIVVIVKYFGIAVEGFTWNVLIFLSLIVALLNSILIYQNVVFEGSKMKFILTFPFSRPQKFFNSFPYYIILILPEGILTIYFFDFGKFLVVLISLLIFILFIKSAMMAIGKQPLKVIKILSLFFFVSFILLLYKGQLIVVILSFGFSYFLYLRNYRLEKFDSIS
ncbi:Uncharacterised protein [Sphingobacterium mizutaii]|uniref:Uncharacterized protein n=1 Tax=Sphingobacterium mizutaii TaxID=1010 RepID=A0AAJ4XAJ9_9SPHI|nr:hypothetical protein SAMN05192578_101333 [Sphingobacterium mizutaii]SNV47925.1 Uncharacterised protein [Sphingobacterium mizutaii]